MIAVVVALVGMVDLPAKFGVPLYPFGFAPVFGYLVVMAVAIWRYRLVDITPAFATEEVLARMAEALVVVDPEGIVRVANEKACRLFGASGAVGQPMAAIGRGVLPPDTVEAVLRTGVPVVVESASLAPSGDRRLLEVAASAMRDRTGQPLAAVCLLRDITERKRTEEALQGKTDQLEAVAEALTAFLQSGNWLEASRTLLRSAVAHSHSEFGVIGVVMEARVLHLLASDGRRWEMAVPPDGSASAGPTGEPGRALECPTFDQLVGRVLTRATAVLVNEAGMDPAAGGRAPGHPPLRCFLGVPILQGAEVVGLIGLANRPGGYTEQEQRVVELLGHAAAVLYDSVRRQAREAALETQLHHSQKMDAIGRLAGGIAHDFNNLLTVINAHSRLLLDRLGFEDPSRRKIEQIWKAGERAASLTQQLLTVSRRHMVKPEVFDLNTVVASLAPMLERLIGEDIRFTCRPGPTAGRVRADRGQIEQVLLNLVVNARDAMPTGGRLTIHTANVEVEEARASRPGSLPAGPYVRLTVTDTGHGMDAATQARVFEPFFTTKELGKGTGLGLATVYGILTQHGGTIEVASEPGRGTTFTVYLPRTTDQESIAKTDPGAACRPGGSETILVAEDDDMVRELLRTVLEEHGYRVVEAQNAAEALHLCQAHVGPIHLLLTDLVMPGMSGLLLSERLAAIRPDTKVLFMSGYPNDALARRGRTEANLTVLTKPITPQVLLEAVRATLGPHA